MSSSFPYGLWGAYWNLPVERPGSPVSSAPAGRIRDPLCGSFVAPIPQGQPQEGSES